MSTTHENRIGGNDGANDGMAEFGYSQTLHGDPRLRGGYGGRAEQDRGSRGTYLVPVSLAHLGLAPTMYAGVVITAIGLVACIAWAEETKGRSLHEASAAPLAVPAAEAEYEPVADDRIPEEARTGHTVTPARRAP